MMIAKLAAAIMLIALTFGAGLQVNRPNLIVILKNYGLLGRALLANFIIIPILGVILAKVFRLSPPIATGYLLMAIAPGVPFVLASVRKRGGRLGLAVALAVIMPLLSIVTVPITAKFVLPAGAAAQLSFGHFVVTLILFQLVPLLLGSVVAERLPKLTPDLGRIMQIVFFLAVIVLFALLAKQLVHDVASVYGSNGMWAMLCLVLLSLGTGWWMGGPAREDRRVLGIGTALRNIGLAAVIATTNFHDSLVAASVLTYFLVQFIVTTVAGIYFTRTAQRAIA
jgi:predicted Na+-dependent transporter